MSIYVHGYCSFERIERSIRIYGVGASYDKKYHNSHAMVERDASNIKIVSSILTAVKL